MTASGKTAVVIGATGALGAGVVRALAADSMQVVAIARNAARLEALCQATGAKPIAADATDDAVAARVLREWQPDLLVMCAGASPVLAPLQSHTWETFSLNWEMDTKATFVWLRQALLLPMKPGGHIVVFSSGAAIQGSPLSGGYAGAKRTQWFLTKYAALEAEREKIDLRIQCVLPMLSRNGLGIPAMHAYAERAGIPLAEFAKRMGPPLTPEVAGQAILDLHQQPAKWNQVAYVLGGNGLSSAP